MPRGSEAGSSIALDVRLKIGALIIVAGLMTVVFIWLSPKAPVTIDEGIYHLMVENLTSGNGLFVWNGYEEFPSEELRLKFLRAYDGRLTGQYPFLYAILFAPFYALFGYAGLFIPNILGFGASVFFTFVLARQLFEDVRVAANAALILALCTFLVEYGPGIWPHASVVALGTAAYCLAIHGSKTSTRGVRDAASAAAGLLLGLAIGLRLDAFLLLPGLGAVLLCMGASRVHRTTAFLLGLAPPLGVMAWANRVRFGTWSPFSYGVEGHLASAKTYVPFACLGVAAFVTVVAATRPVVKSTWRRHRPTWTVIAGFAALAVLLPFAIPSVRALSGSMVHGAWVLVVDLRAYSGGALQRGPDGGLIFYGTLKKALLQSCPYLVVTVLPLIGLFREEGKRKEILTLVAASLPVIGMFAYGEWHGGFSFNMRYFLGTLPFMAILAALGLKELSREMSRSARIKARPALIVAGAGALLLSVSRPVVSGGATRMEVREHLILTTPLLIAAALLLAISFWLLLGRPSNGWTQRISLALCTAALLWASGVAFGSDLLWSQAVRMQHQELAAASESVLEPNSILFSSVPHPFTRFSERGVRLAHPLSDEYRDLVPLMKYHLAAGRPVYVLLWDLERFHDGGGQLPPEYQTSSMLTIDGTTLIRVFAPGAAVQVMSSQGTRGPVPALRGATRSRERTVSNAANRPYDCF